MNLYDYYTRPQDLNKYAIAQDTVPVLFFDKLSRKELIKKKSAFTTDAHYAYQYAQYIIEKPFPEGEPVIRTSPEMSYNYSKYIY